MIFLLANWKWLTPTILAAALGVWLGLVKIELADLRLEVAKQESTAATLLDQLNQTAAHQDDLNAQHARDIDAAHAEKMQAIADTGAGFDARLADRVRDAERRARRGCQLPTSPVAPGNPENATTGSDSGSGGINSGAVRKLRDTGLALQADIKDCFAWALENGR